MAQVCHNSCSVKGIVQFERSVAWGLSCLGNSGKIPGLWSSLCPIDLWREASEGSSLLIALVSPVLVYFTSFLRKTERKKREIIQNGTLWLQNISVWIHTVCVAYVCVLPKCPMLILWSSNQKKSKLCSNRHTPKPPTHTHTHTQFPWL